MRSRAMIECRQYRAMHADIDEHDHQDHEADGNPKFRFSEHPVLSLQGRVDGAVTDWASGCTPASRCNDRSSRIRRNAARTLLIAAWRVEAMVFLDLGKLGRQPVFQDPCVRLRRPR